MTTQRKNINVQPRDLFSRHFQYSSFVKFDKSLSFNQLIRAALNYKKALLSLDRNDDKVTAILEQLFDPTDWPNLNRTAQEISKLGKEPVFSKKEKIISLITLCLLTIMASIAYFSSIQFVSNNDLKIALITGVSIMVLGCLFGFFHCLKPKMTLNKAKKQFSKDAKAFIEGNSEFVISVCEAIKEVNGNNSALDTMEAITFLTSVAEKTASYSGNILDAFKYYLADKNADQDCYIKVLSSIQALNHYETDGSSIYEIKELLFIFNTIFNNLMLNKGSSQYIEECNVKGIVWVFSKIHKHSDIGSIENNQIYNILEKLSQLTTKINSYPNLFKKEMDAIFYLARYRRPEILDDPIFFNSILPIILSAVNDIDTFRDAKSYKFLIEYYEKYSDKKSICFTELFCKVVKSQCVSRRSDGIDSNDEKAIKILKNTSIKQPEVIKYVVPLFIEISNNLCCDTDTTVSSHLDIIKEAYPEQYLLAENQYRSSSLKHLVKNGMFQNNQSRSLNDFVKENHSWPGFKP